MWGICRPREDFSSVARLSLADNITFLNIYMHSLDVGVS